MKNEYNILLRDRGNTFNINMHTYRTMAVSKEEAIGKMVMEKPNFRVEDIQKIHENDFVEPIKVVYIEEEFEKSIKKAKQLL